MLVPCSTDTLCRLQVQVYALARNTQTTNQVLRRFGLVVLPKIGDHVLYLVKMQSCFMPACIAVFACRAVEDST